MRFLLLVVAHAQMRVVWIGREDHPSHALREVIDVFVDGFGASVEHVDAAVFRVMPASPRECSWPDMYGAGEAGVLAAHRRAWRTVLGCPLADTCDGSLACFFQRERSECEPRRNFSWAVVLEDDAIWVPVDRRPLVGELRRQFAMAADADLFWLGACGPGQPDQLYRDKTWLCTHAYAITPNGASTLLEFVTLPCEDPATRPKKSVKRPAVDWQLRHLCNPKAPHRTYLPPRARLNCSGVHDINPDLVYVPSGDDGIRKNTKGLLVQADRPSLHRGIDLNFDLAKHHHRSDSS